MGEDPEPIKTTPAAEERRQQEASMKKMTEQDIQRLATGSTRYEMRDGIMTVSSYYGEEEIKIDLRKLTPEMLEELAPDDWEEDEEMDEWEEPKKGNFWRPDVRIYTEQEPVDRNDPESAKTAIEYGLPQGFSQDAKEAWDYFDGAGFIFEYKGHLVITDESLELTEAGDGTPGNPYGFPRLIADSWEAIEAWLEGVKEDLEEEEEEDWE